MFYTLATGGTMNTQNLNLARKWRSKNFDQIIGQELSIRMLKNSLYLDHYFPVYLFSGQKGCGKTSTARVFSAAINCDHLADFQKDPKNNSIPCLTCGSCQAMATGKHPDFIEIDAASNTGVDNVRNIIDSSSLLPLMGRKKIYLIDEAHMLSKAAFNAFLKLMEEPPSTVIFILATTDTQKIIETVKSRCFAVYFKPVETQGLVSHLSAVCDAEGIAYDEPALNLIIRETSGSVRDALNLLEQVRFSALQVTPEAVYRVLGQLDEERLLRLLETVLFKGSGELLRFIQEIELERFSAEYLWKQLVEAVRACIWIKNGVVPRSFGSYTAQLQFLTQGISLAALNNILELFYRNENIFRKTTAQHAFIEIILLRLCKKNESNSNSNMPAIAAGPSTGDTFEELEALEDDEEEGEDEESADFSTTGNDLWNRLTEKIDILHDPLLSSIFKQGVLQEYNEQTGMLHVLFPKQLTFFNDLIQSTKIQWQPLFEQVLGKTLELEAIFTREESNTTVRVSSLPKVQPALVPEKNVEKKASGTPFVSKVPQKKYSSVAMPERNELKLDVSDKNEWPTANLLLEYFPGTITQIRENV